MAEEGVRPSDETLPRAEGIVNEERWEDACGAPSRPSDDAEEETPSVCARAEREPEDATWVSFDPGSERGKECGMLTTSDADDAASVIPFASSPRTMLPLLLAFLLCEFAA